MAYGKVKADALIYNTGGNDVEVTISEIMTSSGSLSNYALLAGATFTGDINFDAGVIVKGDSTNGSGELTLNCENNSHGVKIKGPPHSAGANYTLILPNNTGTNGQVLTTNGSGVSSWSSVLPLSGGTLTGGLTGTTANFSGNVGIGTSSPQTITHIFGENPILRIQDSSTPIADAFAAIQLGESGTNEALGNYWQIAMEGDSGTSSDHLTFKDGTGERMRINSSGNVGIGTTSPSSKLHVADGGGIFIQDTGGTERTTQVLQSGNSLFVDLRNDASNGQLVIRGKGGGSASEYMRIDSSGRLLVGTSNEVSTSSHAKIQAASSGGASLALGRADAAVTAGNDIGLIRFYGNDGGTYQECARIGAEADLSHAANDKPGRLVFSTTADGASSPTERMRIHSNGTIGMAMGLFTDTSVALNSGNGGFVVTPEGGVEVAETNGTVFKVNRMGSDGTLVGFHQAGTLEGSINVSGSLVSLSGAHLSRWSQLPGGTERIEILRGSVLSNLDEMCEWGEEDNEQLNRMKVSDVEGDSNVAGVFQSWDDDDDTYTNDFYCSMTGDHIIRIGQGVTVERGDLLMSAGDGTAKPQDDDIVRSKTIAKVTSTNVSETYADGSYCVPCVLMAC